MFTIIETENIGEGGGRIQGRYLNNVCLHSNSKQECKSVSIVLKNGIRFDSLLVLFTGRGNPRKRVKWVATMYPINPGFKTSFKIWTVDYSANPMGVLVAHKIVDFYREIHPKALSPYFRRSRAFFVAVGAAHDFHHSAHLIRAKLNLPRWSIYRSPWRRSAAKASAV